MELRGSTAFSRIGGTWPRPFSAVLLLAFLIALPALSADWPQWRGPGGLGVADESLELPLTWDAESPNIRWRAEIPGEGISSPIVSNGQVFVTSAYEGSGRSRTVAKLAVALMAVAFLALALRRRREGVSLIVVVLSFVFILLALLITFKPDLFYEAGNPGRVWRTSGATALIGLAAAFGWFRAASRWRLLGALALAAGAWFIVRYMPWTQLGPVALEKRLTFALPGIAGAVIYGYRYLRRRKDAIPARGGSGLAYALPLAALALLVFAPPNYMVGLQRVVLSLDAGSGEILWEKAAFSAPAERKWERSTYATPTPAADGDTVFAYFGAGLAAFSFEGDLIWLERFPEYSAHTRYGAGASPVLVGDTVVMMAENEMYQDAPPSWTAAFDKRSGETVWRVTPPDARDSYGTPMVVGGAGGGASLVTGSWHHIAGYDASSGERQWTLPNTMEQVVASVARQDDLVAVTGGAHNEKTLTVFRLPGPEGGEPEVLWEAKRGVATVCSPVFYDGRLFVLTDGGVMTAYRAEGGEQLWKGRLKGDHFASLVAGDGKVYAVNASGATSVVAATDEFEVLAVNELDTLVYASPAIGGGCLLIRTTSELICIEAGKREAPLPADAETSS